MKQHKVRGGGATRTVEAINRRTDALEARWGSLVLEVSLGMRVRVESIDLPSLGGVKVS